MKRPTGGAERSSGWCGAVHEYDLGLPATEPRAVGGSSPHWGLHPSWRGPFRVS
jgi:hypothetical protein